jgi:tetratricopeptide (TPR) repeat protein
MKLLAPAVLLAVNAVLVPSLSLAQTQPSGTATISVSELSMPQKAVNALNKGTALLMKGDAKGSLPYFKAVIELAPAASFRVYHNLALAYYRLDQLDAAEANFQKAIDISKGSFAPSLFAMSMVLYRRGDLHHAESIAENGLLLTPGSGVGKYCLGLIQYSLGRLNDAERNARSALQLDAAETDAYVLLGHIHERLQNPSAVIADVQSYLKLSASRDLQSDAEDLLRRARQNPAPLAAALN